MNSRGQCQQGPLLLPLPLGEDRGEGDLNHSVPSLCKPDMVYVLDRGHGLHFYALSFPCQPLAGVILFVR